MVEMTQGHPSVGFVAHKDLPPGSFLPDGWNEGPSAPDSESSSSGSLCCSVLWNLCVSLCLNLELLSVSDHIGVTVCLSFPMEQL